jgi:hypothetical protein
MLGRTLRIKRGGVGGLTSNKVGLPPQIAKGHILRTKPGTCPCVPQEKKGVRRFVSTLTGKVRVGEEGPGANYDSMGSHEE